jgi:hypothetical protein
MNMETREDRNRKLEGYPDNDLISRRRTIDGHIAVIQKLMAGFDAASRESEALQLAISTLAVTEAAFAQDEPCPNCGHTESRWYLWGLPFSEGGANTRHIVCADCGAVEYKGLRPIKSWCSSAPYSG